MVETAAPSQVRLNRGRLAVELAALRLGRHRGAMVGFTFARPEVQDSGAPCHAPGEAQA